MKKLAQWLYQVLGFPWITALEKTSLKPGDLLVVHCAPAHCTADDINRIRADLDDFLPAGVQCVVMLGDVRIDVVRTIDPATRPMQSGSLPRTPIGG